MKRSYMGVSLLIVVLALVAQLSLFFPAAQADQNMYSSNTPNPTTNTSTKQGTTCRQKCGFSYRKCHDFAGVMSNVCLVRYRNCLSKC